MAYTARHPPPLHGDEAVALLRVEPLHGAGNHVACYSSLPERTDSGVLRCLTCTAERSMRPRAMSIDSGAAASCVNKESIDQAARPAVGERPRRRAKCETSLNRPA